MGKSYDRSRELREFVSEHERLAPLLAKITKSDGSLCWQVGSHVQANEVAPLDFIAHGIFSQLDHFTLRNRIIWHFGHGAHAGRRFSGRYETVLWYSHGENYVFNLDPVRIPQKYPGKRHYKGARRGQFSGNPGGKNPTDVWEIPNVKANHVEKTAHPCQFPVALAERLVLALTNPGDLVLDPFVGSGSTAVAALKHGRRFIGAELVPEYCRVTRERLAHLQSGKLRTRPLNQPVWEPRPGDAVAQRPSHFLFNTVDADA